MKLTPLQIPCFQASPKTSAAAIIASSMLAITSAQGVSILDINDGSYEFGGTTSVGSYDTYFEGFYKNSVSVTGSGEQRFLKIGENITPNIAGFQAGWNSTTQSNGQVTATGTINDVNNEVHEYDNMIQAENGPNVDYTLDLNDVPVLEANNSYVFLFDPNEASNDAIDIIALQIYISDTANYSSYTDITANAVKIYDLDLAGNGDQTVRVNTTSTGSNYWDMGLYIPVEAFASATDENWTNTYVHFYVEYENAEAGNDEWGVDAGAADIIPEPSSVLLLSLGALASLVRRRRA